MSSVVSNLTKSLSPATLNRIFQTFDRRMSVIVGLCWLTTFAVIVAAIYTIHLTVAAQHEAEKVVAAEPILPAIVTQSLPSKDGQAMAEKLQRHHPELNISYQEGTLSVAATNGAKFNDWLGILGQIDTMYPNFHWKIKEMCIGTQCGRQELMSINLTAEKVEFSASQEADKK